MCSFKISSSSKCPSPARAQAVHELTIKKNLATMLKTILLALAFGNNKPAANWRKWSLNWEPGFDGLRCLLSRWTSSQVVTWSMCQITSATVSGRCYQPASSVMLSSTPSDRPPTRMSPSRCTSVAASSTTCSTSLYPAFGSTFSVCWHSACRRNPAKRQDDL